MNVSRFVHDRQHTQQSVLYPNVRRVLKHDASPQRVGFEGLGRKLTVADVGKQVIKPFPIYLPNAHDPHPYDWSYVPESPSEEQVRRAYSVVKSVTETHILVQRVDPHAPMQGDALHVNENWIPVDEYRAFLRFQYLPHPASFRVIGQR